MLPSIILAMLTHSGHHVHHVVEIATAQKPVPVQVKDLKGVMDFLVHVGFGTERRHHVEEFGEIHEVVVRHAKGLAYAILEWITAQLW